MQSNAAPPPRFTIRTCNALPLGVPSPPGSLPVATQVHAYRLPGYWADVGGSVGDFYAANMSLLSDPPSISFNAPINSPFFKWVCRDCRHLLGHTGTIRTL